MKKNKSALYLIIVLFGVFCFKSIKINAQENDVVIEGELGSFYTSSQTIFKIFSSSASKIKVVVDGVENGTKELIKDTTNNVWIGYVAGDLLGKEYSYTIEDENGTVYENVLDPYGKYLSCDGQKNVVYDNDLIGFDEWGNQKSNLITKDINKIIYGINVENFTSHNTWNGSDDNRGKLLGVIESGTRYNNQLTGYDYVKNLGITYLELSYVYNYDSPFAIKKELISGNEAFSGCLELKKLVNSFYSSNIGIIYSFNLNNFSSNFLDNLYKIDDQFYLTEDGKLDLNSNVVKKYIYDFVLYYISAFKLSGIKIDNMSDYPVNFINDISKELVALNPNVVIYGDGSYESLDENKAGENNLSKLEDVKMINGSLNYALFGDLLNNVDKGLLDGEYSDKNIETLKFALLSSVDNGQINYSLVDGVSYKKYWENTTSYQLINYIGKREGLSIYDKLMLSNITGDQIIKQKVMLAFGTQMLSGGIPYIYSGNEFLLSYLDSSNSEQSVCTQNESFCFYTNESKKLIDWSYVSKNESFITSFKSLINFRKNNSFVQTEANILKNNVDIYEKSEMPGVIGYIRNYPNAYVRDTQKLFIVFNYSNNEYILKNMESKGWYGLYNYNSSLRDGESIILKPISLYSEAKQKQPKVNQWVTLILVLGLIGLLYYINIMLNKKLVEKKGYDIKDISKKYRPFINKDKINKKETQQVEVLKSEESNKNVEEEKNEENKNGSN